MHVVLFYFIAPCATGIKQTLRIKQVGGVDGYLKEDSVVNQVRAISRLQLRVLNEHWAPGRHVHWIGRALKTRASGVRTKRVCHVFACAPLVQDGQRDFLAERPGQKFVVIPLHHYKEQ